MLAAAGMLGLTAAGPRTSTLPGKFSRAITLITSGQAVAAYNAAQRALGTRGPATLAASAAGGAPAGGGLAPVVIAVIGIVIVGPALALLIVARRRRGEHPPEFVTPHSVFTAARTATEAELREVARGQVIELGEEIEKPGPRDLPDRGPRAGLPRSGRLRGRRRA